MNCQLELRSHANTSLQIELLEFDLEAPDDVAAGVNDDPSGLVQAASSVEASIRALNSNRSSVLLASSTSSCQRDYLSIGAEQIRLCGTQSPFTTILNVPGSAVDDSIRRTVFKFVSDDALTRRGFWLKLRATSSSSSWSNTEWSRLSCPDSSFVLVDRVCVRVYEQELSWYDAHTFCSKSGYSLALIDSFELDKQLNRIVFDATTDLVQPGLFNLSNTKATTTSSSTG